MTAPAQFIGRDPSRSRLTDAQEGFSGGMNLTVNGRLAPNQYAVGYNVRIAGDGDLQPRQGTRRCHVAAINGGTSIVHGFSWRRANGTTQELMTMSDGSVWTGTYDDSSGTPTLSSITSIAAAATLSGVPSIAAFRDLAGNEKAYIADGQNHISVWDGTTFGNHTVGPAGVALTFIWTYNHRLFGIVGNSETLYFSNLDDGDSLGVVASSGGFVTMRTFGGQSVMGGVAVGAYNVIGHRGALSVFRGLTTDDIAIDTGSMGISGSLGVTVPRTFVVLDQGQGGPNLALVHSTLGLAAIAGGAVQLLDAPTMPDALISDPAYPSGFLAATNGVTRFAVRNARYKEYWVGAVGNFPIYVYSYKYGCWEATFDYFATGALKPIQSIWETRTPAGAYQILYGSTDGFVRTIDAPEGSSVETYMDDTLQNGTGGTAYNWSVQCRRFWCGKRRQTKQWVNVAATVRLKGGSINVTEVAPNSAGTGTDVVNQPSTLQNTEFGTILTKNVPKSSQYLDVTYANTTANPQVRLVAVDVEAAPLGERGA